MKKLIQQDPIIEVQLKRAVSVIKEGGVILYPTDTIWGIGCDATNSEAVSKIYKIKHREDSKALVTLVSDLDMLARYVEQIPAIALDLIEVNDAPMTLIYPKAQGLAHNAIASDGSIAIRIPMNNFCRQLCRKARVPIISTSANISEEPSPKNFVSISEEIKGSVDHIVPPFVEEKNSTHKASQIIKVELDGSIKIIRK